MYVVIEHGPHKILGCHLEKTEARALARVVLIAEDGERDARDAEDCVFHEKTWQDKDDEDYHITVADMRYPAAP
jgi:hypothetical protein